MIRDLSDLNSVGTWIVFVAFCLLAIAAIAVVLTELDPMEALLVVVGLPIAFGILGALRERFLYDDPPPPLVVRMPNHVTPGDRLAVVVDGRTIYYTKED